MTEKKNAPMYGIGIVSIFMIFAVLCLMTFALLAISSAKADLRLSEKNADYVKRYYTMSAMADKILVSAKELWTEGEKPIPNDFAANLSASYGMDFTATDSDDGLLFQFSVGDKDSVTLFVSCVLSAPGTADRLAFRDYTLVNADITDDIDWNLPVWE